MLYLGVDLAWGEGGAAKPANQSGIAALEPGGVIAGAGWTVGLDETVDWILRHAAPETLLFVDAPLLVENPDGQRVAERQVGQRYGRWWVSANSTNTASARLAGFISASDSNESDGATTTADEALPTPDARSASATRTPRSSESKSSDTTTSALRTSAPREGRRRAKRTQRARARVTN
jgi:hypothetical protein